MIQVQEDVFCMDKCLWKSVQVLEILGFRITSIVFKLSSDQHEDIHVCAPQSKISRNTNLYYVRYILLYLI